MQTTTLTPSILDGPRPASAERFVVPGAARVTGAVADAVVRLDIAEHERRRAAGLGDVPSLDVLDALMCVPEGVDVPVADLGPVTLSHLRRAPAGCVMWVNGGWALRRLAVMPLSVELVIVRSTSWRAAIRRAAAFSPFATRVVLLDRLPSSWPAGSFDAVACGVGVWANHDGAVVEYVAPEPFQLRWVKPARWRFAERAYGEWLRSSRP